MHHLPVSQNPLKTRSDLQRLAMDLWSPLEPAFRADGAGTLLGDHRAWYGRKAENMEGFSRALWGLGPLRAGGGGAAVDWALLRSILVAGTGPGGWGEITDYSQLIVETPTMTLALVWARADLWDPLTPGEQTQVVEWISRINHVRVVENNWLWFRVITNAALRALGQPHDADREAADLDMIETMWHGDRGYSDGPVEHYDYYVPMAMHLYGLLYAQLAADHAPARAAEFRRRARACTPDFLTWFAADGAAIPFGRSLQYRFAQGGFWSALAFAGEEALPWGVIKGVLLRHLRYWMALPIFSESGRLSLGYGYPQPQMSESYGGSAGPYWAQKAFLVLALPESHPFWQAEELELPDLPTVSVQPGPSFLVTRPADNSDAIALAASRSARSWLRHNAAKYHKFAYSAAFAFSVPLGNGALNHVAPDSTLALSDDDGAHWRVRENSTDIEISKDKLVARWQPWPDVQIETTLTPDGEGGHYREHVITTARSLVSFEGGFCLPRDSADCHRYQSEISDTDGARTPQTMDTEPGTHLLWPLASLPGLSGQHPPGTHTLRCHVRARINPKVG